MLGLRCSPAVWALLALALAGVAQCRHLPSMKGRSLLQTACEISFEEKVDACANMRAREPGMDCCIGMQALDSACLSERSDSLAAQVDQGSARNLNNILESCRATPGPAPGPAPTSGDAPAAAPTVAPAAGPGALPEGRVYIAWSGVTSLGNMTCRDYAGGGAFLSSSESAGPMWVATGSDRPSDAELLPIGERWCANRAVAADEWFAAMDAGGRTAQIAFFVLAAFECDADGARLWEWLANGVINDVRFRSQQAALRYAQAMADAADASGLSFCVSMIVEDANGQVLFNQAIHVGPGPESPEGCLPGYQQSLAICGDGDPMAPSSPCCAALDALGDTCRDTLTDNTDITVMTAYNLLATGCRP